MIKSFRGSATTDLFHGEPSKASRSIPQDLWKVARRKLDMLNAAHALSDLRAPPANRLEALRGDRAGTYSIRVNDQYRVVFRWQQNDAYDVEIVDYH